MKLFVTGATGFLGRAFCQAALDSGHRVLALHRSAQHTLPIGCESTGGALGEICWRDIERFAPDAALHLAWIATPGLYLNAPDNEQLVGQSTDLFSNLVKLGVSYIAGAGTCIEYAASSFPLSERSPLDPKFPYSRAKVETAHRLQALAEKNGIEWSWLRIFYPYGEGENTGRLPTMLMSKLTRGEALELRTPDSIKDYIHVRDLATAMLCTMEARVVGPVNMGTGVGIRVVDLARQIARCCGADESLVKSASTPDIDPNPVSVADISKLRRTGWQPAVTLDEGLVRLRNSLCE